ncbi:MAG: hypothetical protein K2Q07_01750 [Burkholderiaceae bacterium]|nr:hypothetical protein [Burkholderiaceae bacterium]
MKTCSWLVALALLISGCGELSYKRGASTQDLETAKRACQSADGEKAAGQCLEDRGWTVKKLDDIDLFATAGVSPDNRNPSAFVTPEFAPVVPAKSAAAPIPPAENSPAAAEKPMVPSPPSPTSPLDVYTISSWWKMGADREALAADTHDCVAMLGPAHKPSETTQQVTRGFVVCMHAKGWKALRAMAS